MKGMRVKILLINGSPKGRQSNTYRLATSFVEGLRDALSRQGKESELEEVEVSSLDIRPCRGCFGCWKATPGQCVIKDDMAWVLQKRILADLVVWSFPLYFFNVPGPLKNLIDRQLPMALPFMSEAADGYGSGGHESRYDVSGIRNVLVSTCGFYSAEGNYDSVHAMFDHFLGKGNYAEILCGQGELFRVKELSRQTDAYLALVRQAGREYASGGIAAETEARLRELILPKETFEAAADASWGMSRETGRKDPDDLTFTRQMAALYNTSAYDGTDRVLEMNYTDLGRSYQILLGRDGSEVVTDGSLATTTRIDTPFEVWLQIARGEIGGSEALGKRLYSVDGDFDLMVNWDKYFGASDDSGETRAASARSDEAPLRPPTMTTMLVPWIAFWVAVSISAYTGAVVSLAVTALMPVFTTFACKRQIARWDWLSFFFVALLSLVAYFTGNGDLATNVGYLAFGLLWLLSCMGGEDLCATYVKSGFGGKAALGNPLFTKTTRILTMAWGALYLAIAAWTFLARQAGLGHLVLVANNVAPIFMGAFTAWFQKWYPAHLARG